MFKNGIMGNLKYFSLLMAAGMFAACSDNLDNAGDAGKNTLETTEGYVRVAVHTPTTSGSMSRADEDFGDGTANEYKINDGVIVFFKATKGETNPDANATFVSAYPLDGLATQGGDGNQVTEKVVTVSTAPMIDEDKEKLYALVILNTPSVVVVGADDHSLTLNGTKLTPAEGENTGSKLSDFTKALTRQQLSTYTGEDNDFTMCNAPLSTVAGNNLSTADPAAVAKTLVPVEVYPTQNEAQSNPAARIYVERVVAKVTLKGFTYTAEGKKYTKEVKNTAGVYAGDIVQLDGWILNVTNNSTALVRNVSGFNKSGWLASDNNNVIARFAGTNGIPMDYSNTVNYYRIYWAEDGNYNNDYADGNYKTDFTVYSSPDNLPVVEKWNKNTADNNGDVNKDYALYCLENTMAAEKQNQNQTTSVLLQTTYLTKFQGQSAAAPQDFFICGASPVKYPLSDITLDGSAGTLPGIISFVVEKANVVLENDIREGELAVNTDAVAGIYDNTDGKKISDLFTYTDKGSNYTDLTQVWNAIWSQVGTIRYYKEGISYYYAAFIRHFYDDETPWSDGEAYGIQHLGRYGVVRNNWYEVNINSISGPGEPEIIEPEGPDDKAEGYIRAEINVLSWAKRSQNVDL